ncbi:hypothetical protein TanjilG_09685 [Lupinus angustifolius]|uniref:Protein XRI1 n=1 Tax=Lupinus angustifolius TaxID=3871 RepID=A0A4P1R3W5_LUPAN|nr:PREDICTED: uncharacterized protein LOC109361681 [Lupinus angustifolius]OIW00716.1 hypothetical protein TanjilG_09685 [Lupinus angustifolius]
MNELHSLAYTTTSLHNSSLSWDYHHNLGVLNSDKMSLMPTMDGNATSFSSHQEYSDFSSGYLEDALIEFTSKRRRMMPCSDEQSNSNSTEEFEKSLWNFNFNSIWHQQQVETFNCMSHIERIFGFSDEHISKSRSFMSEEPNVLVAETKKPEETINAESESPNSCSSSYKEPVISKTTEVNLLYKDPTVTPTSISDEMIRKKKVITSGTRVVYPFAMVKPGGREGDVTLNDINERILMPPTRPVRHPVGDFACRPCVSAQGPGLSGKAVVALTRIHTQGRRGTITIIRTKG